METFDTEAVPEDELNAFLAMDEDVTAVDEMCRLVYEYATEQDETFCCQAFTLNGNGGVDTTGTLTHATTRTL